MNGFTYGSHTDERARPYLERGSAPCFSNRSTTACASASLPACRPRLTAMCSGGFPSQLRVALAPDCSRTAAHATLPVARYDTMVSHVFLTAVCFCDQDHSLVVLGTDQKHKSCVLVDNLGQCLNQAWFDKSCRSNDTYSSFTEKHSMLSIAEPHHTPPCLWGGSEHHMCFHTRHCSFLFRAACC